MKTQDRPYDIQLIRRQAVRHMNQGSLTEDYPLDSEMAVSLLNDALASEILCTLRYRQHQVMANGINYMPIAAEFEEHAENESQHMMKLAHRIAQLGGQPDFNPASVAARSDTEFGTGIDLLTMIREDLVAERVAVEVYRKLVQWFGDKDPTTRRMLEHILADEENHASELAELLVATERTSESLS